MTTVAGPSKRLSAAMRYAVLNGGKRMRAALVMGAARLAQGVAHDAALDRRTLRVAAAVECVHAYSLVHDDLPAMDDAATRRGQPSTHLAFDDATAILAGDALQTLAFEILADPLTHPFGVPPHEPFASVSHPHHFENVVDTSFEVGAAQAVELAVKAEHFFAPEEVGIVGPFGQIANHAADIVGRDIAAAHDFDRAAGGEYKSQQHLDGRSLPGTVRAEIAEDLTLFDGEVEVL